TELTAQPKGQVTTDRRVVKFRRAGRMAFGKMPRAKLKTAQSGCELDRISMAQNSDSLFELLHLERLFQDCDGPLRQDAIQHFTIGVAGDDDDGTLWLLFLGHVVDIIRRTVRQF